MRAGEIRALGGRTPFVLDDTEVGWIVRDGRVDVFAVELVDGRPDGRRHAVCSAASGDLLVGVEPSGALALIGIGVAPTAVERVPLAEVAADGDGPRARRALGRAAGGAAASARRARRGDARRRRAGRARHRSERRESREEPVWVDAAGLELMGAPAEGWVPVPPSAWVQATRTVTLTPSTASEALGHGAEGLAAFGRAVLACIAADMAAAEEEAELRLDRLQELDVRAEHAGLRRARRRRARGQRAGRGDGGARAARRLPSRRRRGALRGGRAGSRRAARGARPAGGDRRRRRDCAPGRSHSRATGGAATPGRCWRPPPRTGGPWRCCRAGPAATRWSIRRPARARASTVPSAAHARAAGARVLPTAPRTAARRPRPAALRAP